jgi:hypothetical protein
MAVYWKRRTCLPPFPIQSQEFNIHLNVVTRYLLVISPGMDFADARAAWEPVQTMAPEDAIDGCIRHSNRMIARHVPHDPLGPEVVLPSQMENLLLDL